MATTWKDITKRKFTQGDWSLLIANLLPVAGVWFLDWNPKEVFLVYCFETIIIGFFTLVKLGITGAFKKKDDWSNQSNVTTKQPAIFFMIFFLVHYGMFVTIQMSMFFGVSGIGDDAGIGFFNFFLKWPELITYEGGIMLSVFIVSYGFRMINDYVLSGEYKTAPLGYIMFQPYGRIFVQQITVILGSMLLQFGAGKIFILVFAFIKIFFEVFVDFNEILKKGAKGELKSNDEANTG